MEQPSPITGKFLDAETPGNLNQISFETNFIKTAKLTSLLPIAIRFAVALP
jgi:hypothetical protein